MLGVLGRHDTHAHHAIGVLGGSATLPGTLGAGPARTRTKHLTIDINEVDGGTRLRARCGRRVKVDIMAHRPHGGKVVGIQVGGKWTDGTGSVENSLLVDGYLSKISKELVWDYSPDDWMAPWTITNPSVD